MRCYTCKKHKILLNKGQLIESPLLFVHGAMCVKRMMVTDVNHEPLSDLYALDH
jgi:hypothetical protein